MKTEQKRLAEIKRIYEEGAATFLARTTDTIIVKNGGDLVEIREKFLNYIPQNSLILDVGCGTGRDAKYFIEHGHRVVGIDICESFITDLQNTIPGEYCIGDVVNLESSVYQKEYDAIWSNASLVHLNREEAKQVIKNCFQVLKKGGYLFVGTKYSTINTHMEDKESKSIPGSIKPYLYYTEGDLCDDLRGVGFTVLDVSLGQGTYGGDQFIRVFCRK